MTIGITNRQAANLVLIFILFSAMLLSPQLLCIGECAETEAGANQVFRLGEIEVTAKQEERPAPSVDKLYSEEMRLFEKNDVAEAVNLIPGVTLSTVGARNEKMIFVRGFDLKHVPLFLDGIPIYVPYDGYPDLARFNTFDLSEIIVSKGFTSVLYGPNTMGGAINMVSRAPQKPFEMDLGVGYASGDTFESYANFGGNQGKWYLQGGAVYVDSDDFSLSDDFTPKPGQGSGDRANSYHTDKRINFKVGLTPNATDTYAVSYINQKGEKGVPPYVGYDSRNTVRWWQWPYWDKESVYFNSETAIPADSYVKTRLYYDIFKNSLFSFDDATYTKISKKYAFKSWYNDYTYGGSLELGSSYISGNTIKAAVHYKDDVHREHNEGYPIQHFEDRMISVGLEDTFNFTGCFYAVAGISYDRVETERAQDLVSATKTFKNFPLGDTDAFNPQGGLFYKLNDTGLLHVSVAKKTRLPSIKDKFSYKLGTALPNPDLQPEESINYELGYKDVLFGKLTTEANLFYSDISDFILQKTIPDPSNPSKTLFQNQNIGDINQYGFELSLSGQLLPSLNGGANYSYIQYENKTTSDKLLNFPHHKIFGYLQYMTPLTGLSLLGSAEYNSDRYSSSDAVRVAKGYTLINTKAIYEIYRGLSVEGGINNITDENYAIDEGFPLEGRSYFANLRYRY